MNSFPENPEPAPDSAAQPAAGEAVFAPLPAPPDPVWTGLDVFRIVLMEIVLFFCIILVLIVTFPAATFRDKLTKVGNSPELVLSAQAFSYVLLLGFMYIVVKKERGSSTFWKAIHWNWPEKVWLYIAMGVLLEVAVLIAARFVTLPKRTPLEALLRRPAVLFLISAFAPTLGALMEEVFFRGFLYPVLVRGSESLLLKMMWPTPKVSPLHDPVRRHRYAVIAGITISGLGFGLLHAPEYGYSVPLVTLLIVIGCILGVVRALKNSVAASVLVHCAYNGTIILIIAAATGGFRHLERLGQ